MKKIHLMIILFSLISVRVNAQIKLDENKVAQFANEVFLNCNQYNTPQYYESYKNQIKKIEIITTNELSEIGKPAVSIKTISLKNKCNANIMHDNATNFTPENFNPLKYFFPKSESALYFQIDDTQYVIVVKPY